MDTAGGIASNQAFLLLFLLMVRNYGTEIVPQYPHVSWKDCWLTAPVDTVKVISKLNFLKSNAALANER